jgi:RimJ/RimL family protein N-acetyltransferase
MKLETERLILRRPLKKDIPSLIRNINNLEISKWLLVVPHPYTKADAEWWINHCKENESQNPRRSYNFGVQLKGEEGVIGGVGLSSVDLKNGVADIGYWLGQDYWRKGIVGEANTLLLDYAFNHLGLNRIKIPLFEGNQGSEGMAKFLGARFEKLTDEKVTCKATGEQHREKVYWVHKEDWLRRRRI